MPSARTWRSPRGSCETRRRSWPPRCSGPRPTPSASTTAAGRSGGRFRGGQDPGGRAPHLRRLRASRGDRGLAGRPDDLPGRGRAGGRIGPGPEGPRSTLAPRDSNAPRRRRRRDAGARSWRPPSSGRRARPASGPATRRSCVRTARSRVSSGAPARRLRSASTRCVRWRAGEPLLLRILPGAAEGEPEAEEGSVTVKNPCLSGGALEVFLEPHLPAADHAGRRRRRRSRSRWRIWRGGWDMRSSPARRSRPDPAPDDAAVVVASHGHDEERVLTEALRSGVPYVALVASEVRGRAVRESLDVSEEERARLHTPAGLEIGAETPGGDRARDPRGDRRPAAGGRGRAGRRSRGTARRSRRPPAESPEPSPAEPAPVVLSTETAIDPVCGMEVAVSEASIQLERDGELYYFCSEGCRDTFSAQGVPDGAAH